MNVPLDSQLGLTTEQLFVRVYTYTGCHQLLTSGGECQAIAALAIIMLKQMVESSSRLGGINFVWKHFQHEFNSGKWAVREGVLWWMLQIFTVPHFKIVNSTKTYWWTVIILPKAKFLYVTLFLTIISMYVKCHCFISYDSEWFTKIISLQNNIMISLFTFIHLKQQASSMVIMRCDTRVIYGWGVIFLHLRLNRP